MTEHRKGRLLLVDDDPSLRRLMTIRLEGVGHTVASVESADRALEVLGEFGAECVITDLRMDGMDGLDLLQRLSINHPNVPVIVITAHGTIPDAVSATQAGALDFLAKPVDKETLLARVDQALAQGGMPARDWDSIWQARIVTRSPMMRERLAEARMVAETDSSILITGESGTGKEVMARVMHEASPRAEHSFVALNCGAMPEQLLESELFGHEKGAFTDAKSAQPGLFRSAEGGTIFLDEIGDMPIALQVKLLRVLQEREVRPVGGRHSIPVDVRVISATHRNLDEAIAEGAFREDLYYRLAVVSLALPSLAQRPEDIAPLVRHFLDRLARRAGQRPKVYAPDAMERLTAYTWPGNIRQLSNVVEHNVALTRGPVIGRAAVDKALAQHGDPDASTSSIRPLAQARDEFVHDYLVQLLRITEGNVARSARLAQRNRTEFYKLLNRHAIDPAQFKH
ncbi:sigma 54-interacting transcriptional regulator [Salinisphaera hydrothermalis]|uniref:Response regulator GlrR n=1 Tax=Salinisphaera hydrothermalis (strain C41B8) TaxID=1304275 RepID=A0A084IPA8_SALHC|nr:sigma 54-interacting transcriptional regulator [Salinisphaera hydrothermalis]KEZ78542.1 response regulator GlrR [Salinisphaera hydrothermalis C41B8]